MASGRFIAYYRVSTTKQGISGLGLEAQKQTVAAYLNGGRWTIFEEFTEVESGRRSDRPELARALAACRLHRCPLIVANVSRLTRSAAFLNSLLASKVDVRFCDLPEVSGATGRFMLGQMAAVAELEAGLISERTRKALAASEKPKGGFRGAKHYMLTPADTEAAAAARRARAAARATDLAPEIRRIQAAGVTSLRGIAAALAEKGIEAPRGGSTWSAAQVSRVLANIPA